MARLLPRPSPPALVGTEAWAASSTIVFHSPHDSQRPLHFGAEAPQA
jgi:hypothetical protein